MNDEVKPPQRLLVMDVDSTLIEQEGIDLLAKFAGTKAQQKVSEITEQAMQGELDFAESLKARVATLAGLPATVFAQTLVITTFTPGAEELVAEAHRRGWAVGLVSGGFHQTVDVLASQLNISRVAANTLEVDEATNTLTGRVTGKIIDRPAKADALRTWANELNIPLANCIAIGDGANDLDVLALAGIGIAFNAKPTVQAKAKYILNSTKLSDALKIIDENSAEIL